MITLQKLLSELPQGSHDDDDMMVFLGYELVKDQDLSDPAQIAVVFQWLMDSTFSHWFKSFVLAEILKLPVATTALNHIPNGPFYQAAAQSQQKFNRLSR